MADCGLCHGDIKPENFLLNLKQSKTAKKTLSTSNNLLKWFQKKKIVEKTVEPELFIADFGLANKIGGTPVYMSPENLFKTIVGKTDVYGLGMTILYAVSATDLERLHRHFN